MQTLTQSHVNYRLMYHLVWIPKRRFEVLQTGVSQYFAKVLESCRLDRYPDVRIEEISIQLDHIHLMLVIPPKYSISSVVGYLKSCSSRKLRKKFKYLKRGKDSLWSIGYFVSSVGLDESRIRNYVKYQNQQEIGQLKAVWDDEATGKAKRRP